MKYLNYKTNAKGMTRFLLLIILFTGPIRATETGQGAQSNYLQKSTIVKAGFIPFGVILTICYFYQENKKLKQENQDLKHKNEKLEQIGRASCRERVYAPV